MSKPRYRWWGFARRMIRDYPALKRNHAQHGLSHDDQKVYEAVAQAIEATQLRPDGDERIKMIRYIYWNKKRHTVRDAAPQASISEPTAQRWHSDFVRLVGKCYGFTVDDVKEPNKCALMVETKK